VVFDDDSELMGVDAFIYVWKRTKGYEWLGKFVGLPIIKQCAIFAYAIVALLLYWRFKIFNQT
jgi:predicted DCC family thiol-disulfide oxidoreductase YuxK